MNDNELNIVQQVIESAGGYGTFARRMGDKMNTTGLRDIAAGRRVPSEMVRRRIVKASRGRLTEQDIISLTGKDVHDSQTRYDVDPMWEVEEDERRRLIRQRAAKAAKKQLRNNQRRLR